MEASRGASRDEDVARTRFREAQWEEAFGQATASESEESEQALCETHLSSIQLYEAWSP